MNEICIIGAGITGIELAKKLPNAILLEKSRGMGGRIASRRLGGTSFNHGPQDLEIDNKIISDPHLWIKKQAEGLTVLNNWEVTHFELGTKSVRIFGKEKQSIECKKIILTCPAPQTKMILERSKLEANFLEKVRYSSVIQFMTLTQHEFQSQDLEKLFNLKNQKRLSDTQCFSRFEIKEEFLDQFLGMEKDDIKTHCLLLINDIILDSHVHKWRYSEALSSISSEYQFRLADNNVFLAGDYFGTEGVKGSIKSAQRLLGQKLDETL